jgi:glycerol-1-phosphate dehydrogenase [NAD(P)+]
LRLELQEGSDMSIVWPKLEKGAQALKRGSAGWKNFGVVTTRSPWRLAQSAMPEPTQVLFIHSLERKDLKKLTEQLRGLDLLVGLGSGLAMDAAKFLAKVTGIGLAQVLSTSSNNACFTRTAWTFENGARIPERDAPIPQQLILDFELLRQAPARMNRAGAAEILCSHTALFDWKVGHEAGIDTQWDDELERFTRDELKALRHQAAAIGADQLEAFVKIVDVGAKFAKGFTTHPKARFNGGSEHIFSWALEEQCGKRLIHGEAVSLGILLMAHIQSNDPEGAAGVIQAARIGFKPEQLGVSWRDVEATIANLPAYATRIPWYTLLNEFAKRGDEGSRDLAKRFAAAKDFVQRLL